jgi:hypothetical protein
MTNIFMLTGGSHVRSVSKPLRPVFGILWLGRRQGETNRDITLIQNQQSGPFEKAALATELASQAQVGLAPEPDDDGRQHALVSF